MEIECHIPNKGFSDFGLSQLLKRNSALLCIQLCPALESFLGYHYALNTIQIYQNTIESTHLLFWHVFAVIFTFYSHPVFYPIIFVLPIDINLVFATRPAFQLNIVLDIRNIRVSAVQQLLVNLLRKTLVFSVGIHCNSNY